MVLTFDDIELGETLTFVNNPNPGGITKTTHHTGRVTKITSKTVFLDDLTATTESLSGPRPVRYRIFRASWDTRHVQRITPAGLPRRVPNAGSRIAQAAISQ